jgi:outer membrane protein insertion porin family
MSELSHEIRYDNTDSPMDPTEGYSLSFQNEVAGLGGSIKHLRNTFQGRAYYPVTDDLIFSFKGATGYVFGLGDDVKFLERYFLGGNDVRGFANSGMGPRDSVSSNSLGGEWMYSGKFQLTFPLGLPEELGLKGRVFSDLGSVSELNPSNTNVQDSGSIRSSAGFGLTWMSPMGPVGMDAGFPLTKEDYDKTEMIRINFGTRF